MPPIAKRIDKAVIKDTFSLKKIAMMTATITGYTNRIVDAIPASM